MTAKQRFLESMNLGYDQWHDGLGYDLASLDAMTASERVGIETMLLARAPRTWRDLEALEHLRTPAAQGAMAEAYMDPSREVRIAAVRYTGGDDAARTATLVEALERAEFYAGLGQAIDVAAEYHPPAVVDALLRGALHRDGESAVNFAALLFYVYGLADEPFDWEHRPFFLRFSEKDSAAREAAFRDLCSRLSVPVERYLG